MWLDQIIEDVGFALDWDDGECIPKKAQNRIIRGVKRLFDRFAIDDRKISRIEEIEFEITDCKNQFSIGPGNLLDTWGEPLEIHYAAWSHRSQCGCCPTNVCETHSHVGCGTCDDVIRVNEHPGIFMNGNPCRQDSSMRPTELWYQPGEIVFNSKARPGDVLSLRAVMPFNVQISDSCDCKACPNPPEFLFDVCKGECLDHCTLESVLAEARSKFNGDPNFRMETRAMTCHECPQEITVTVTVRCVEKPEPLHNNGGDLPPGYYDAMVRILTYDLAQEAGLTRDQYMRQDRNDAIALLHRHNARPAPFKKNPTVYWNGGGCCEPTLMDGQTPAGQCCPWPN